MIIFDIEVNKKTNRIMDIGATTMEGDEFHSKDIDNFIRYIKQHKKFVFAGHNVIAFDMKYIEKTVLGRFINPKHVIDTLYFSTLLFPKKPYHKLVKDDKLNVEHSNNPLNDSIKAKHLLNDCVIQFSKLDENLKSIFYYLLKDIDGAGAFFKYVYYKPTTTNVHLLINNYFHSRVCLNANLKNLIKKHPLELAFALSYIDVIQDNLDDEAKHIKSLLPPWVLYNFPYVEDILIMLRGKPCHQSTCSYCKENLNSVKALNRYFGYDNFRSFNGINLQEKAVNSALDGDSLVAVFPTGGGKSLTFQLPAFIQGDKLGGLTVVISPLQSLMKDQVDNLFNKNITNAVFINSLLNPLERKDAIDRILDGSVNLLYIAPESLRSKTIFNILLKRHVVRFVIDEAHCFSTWGHDFRPDYLYIGDFIKNIAEAKKMKQPIPISCFTATAKYNVIEDIKTYFKNKLNLEMIEYKTSKGRTNLDYNVLKVTDDEKRYFTLRNILEAHNRPTIIYASRTRTIDKLHKRLSEDGFKVSKFHGQMETEDKILNQNSFMENITNIMVATNAFGMGVDKDDVGVVIHYNISDSLENYLQEAGRAGRKENSEAVCYILYNEEDLDKHFEMLNFSKITNKEISQIWSAIKKELKDDDQFVKTPLEIGRMAGWDEDTLHDISTRVKTSIMALEDVHFIKRGFDSPRVFATSLLVDSAYEARKIIESKKLNPDIEIDVAVAIVSSLVSKKKKTVSDYAAEDRVDYIADRMGIDRYKVIRHINYLRELNILANDNDLYAKINSDTKEKTLFVNLNRYKEFMEYLIENFEESKKSYNIKQLNEEITKKYKPDIKTLRRALSYLDISKLVKIEKRTNDIFDAHLLLEKENVFETIKKRVDIAEFLINFLMKKYESRTIAQKNRFVDFSALEVKNEYIKSLGLIDEKIEIKDVEETILMLQRLGILSFEGGFLVVYSPMTISRIEKNNATRFTLKEYEKLSNHYNNKNKQIHIVGHYAELMEQDKTAAEVFASDYFNMEFNSFIDKYFPGKLKRDLDLKMSINRFNKLFGKLNDEQKAIIEDDKSKIIGVAAGPGSGKTTLLVHKLASIIYNEDVKTEQLLMLTFSRMAALEFRERLKQLIGSVASYIKITTFHSFAFDLLGRQGNLDSSENIVKEAVDRIRNDEVDEFKITKMMLVIDEAQDISEDEYNLIQELIKFNDDLRVIAVGDDDQNIYAFRGSNSKYLKEFTEHKKYELTINYRSGKTIIDYANKLIGINKNRLKTSDVRAHSKSIGQVEVVTYTSLNIIKPVISKVVNDKLNGTTAILTKTNEEAFLISGMLSEMSVQHKLIQENKEIKAFNIFELRTFYDLLLSKTDTKIDYEVWNNVYKEFCEKFQYSVHFKLYDSVINRFFEVYTEPYISDFKEYLIEIDLSAFMDESKLVVANLHKVKGMEFDNVYLVYNDRSYLNEEDIRALYVGLTRAKKNLFIHSTSNLFKNIKLDQVVYMEDHEEYRPTEVIELMMGLQDVHLNYYKYIARNLNKVLPGDRLTLEEDILLYEQLKVGRLSKRAMQTLSERFQRGYQLEHVECYNLVYWYSKDLENELLILLPKLKFKLTNDC